MFTRQIRSALRRRQAAVTETPDLQPEEPKVPSEPVAQLTPRALLVLTAELVGLPEVPDDLTDREVQLGLLAVLQPLVAPVDENGESSARVKVINALAVLAWPDAWPSAVRELAREQLLSAGTELLAEAGATE